ncbi:MAG: GNAT family N-acetyltransferase [bacterium]
MDAKDIQVQAVETRRDLLDFIKFAQHVYKDDPHWVAPLVAERKALLGSGNPFWKHSDRILFLAKRGKRIVGRIEAAVDRNYIEFQRETCGFFGFFECFPDYRIAQRLLDTVHGWLKAKGVSVMRGPFNPSTNDECGFLLEGFDSDPYVMMTYTKKYYLDYMERYGLKKAKDLFAYTMPVNPEPPEKLIRGTEIAKKKNPDVVIRHINMKEYASEVKKVHTVYNASWTKNWGFVPWTGDEFNYLAKQLKPLAEPELVWFAEVDEKPIGFLMALPDYNQVLKKLAGRMGPIEIIKFLLNRKKIRNLRLMAMGVLPQYRRRGIDALLYLESLRVAYRKGYKYCEVSWILEENVLTQRATEMMGGKLYKKYRIYEIDI